MSTIPVNPASNPQGKAFTNATVPAPPKVERETPDSEIIAKPLRVPDFINLKHRNPNMVIYWGNRAVGEKESKMRFSQLIAMGFVPAQPKDVYLVSAGAQQPCPDALAVDGRIIWGDLIAMQIPKKDYVGQTKWNAQTAAKRVQRPGIITKKDEDGNTTETLAFAKVNSKIQPVVPTKAEAELLTGKHLDKATDI